MARREYQGGAVSTTITGGMTNSTTSLVLASTTGWPTGSFSAVIDPGQAGEEKILCTSRSGSTVTITTRGYDGTTASAHVAGATIYPAPTAIDFDEANALVASIGTLGTGVGTFLGTPTSANLAAALTDETGTGANVFATSPVLVTPNLGVPSAIDLTNATNTPADSTKIAKTVLSTTGDTLYASSANTPARLAIGATGNVLTVAGGVPSWAAPAGGSFHTGDQTVATNESTTSNSYTDLATAGPAVTVTTGTKALVSITADCQNGGATSRQYMGFAVSGATTISPVDGQALLAYFAGATTTEFRNSFTFLLTGLTAGSNTFTCKYRSSTGATAIYFGDRRISVIDMGS